MGATPNGLRPPPQEGACATGDAVDLIVVGAGAGGMTAALTAALRGLRVVLCEATEQVGGTTATSAGTIWVPGNRHGVAAGYGDTVEQGRRYLDAILGPDDERGMRDAYLNSAGPAIDDLERHSALAFVSAGHHPDYLELPGAAVSGRALSPLPFDGRLLGRDFVRVRPPIPEFMLLGGMMANKSDVQALIHRYRSVRHFAHAASLVVRYGIDRLRHARGTRLVLGNALVARLLYSLRQVGVDLRFETRLQALERESGRVVAAVFESGGATMRVRTRAGVVLATGGIGHHAALRALVAPAGAPKHSLACASDRGEGIHAAQRIGARLERHAQAFFWQPVSVVPRPAGDHGLFPHLYLDRAKPGLIAVDADGARFVNEGASYHHFVEAMLQVNAGSPAAPVHLVCDADFVRRYGLGVIPPGTRRLSAYERSGYVVLAPTPAALAQRLVLDPTRLADTVSKHNACAVAGHDPAFGKGNTELSRFNGDPSHGPNPCLGPIATPPFVALPVWPADAASSTGLATTADGVVLDEAGVAIAGLYACGNDMASIMRGAYPGPGTTIGPAMVFGYRIGLHARAALDAGSAWTDPSGPQPDRPAYDTTERLSSTA